MIFAPSVFPPPYSHFPLLSRGSLSPYDSWRRLLYLGQISLASLINSFRVPLPRIFLEKKTRRKAYPPTTRDVFIFTPAARVNFRPVLYHFSNRSPTTLLFPLGSHCYPASSPSLFCSLLLLLVQFHLRLTSNCFPSPFSTVEHMSLLDLLHTPILTPPRLSIISLS